MTIQILDVALLDDRARPQLRQWQHVVRSCEAAEFAEHHTAPTLAQLHGKHGDSELRWNLLVVVTDTDPGTAVAAASLRFSRHENQHLGYGTVQVLPQFRRRGVGSQLLAELEHRAHRQGATQLAIEECHRDQHAAAVAGFAARHGYHEALREHRSDLYLAEGGANVASVSAAAIAESQAYPLAHYDTVSSWDAVPDALAQQRVILVNRFNDDVPLGRTAAAREVWTSRRTADWFATLRRQGLRVVETYAIHRDSRQAVAYTTLVVARDDPAKAYQFATVVLPEHRGHRLGVHIKLVNLQQLLAKFPVCQVTTTNATTNEAMLRVNRLLGMHVVGTQTRWQKDLVT